MLRNYSPAAIQDLKQGKDIVRLFLKDRKGFVKHAKELGERPVVPIFAFNQDLMFR